MIGGEKYASLGRGLMVLAAVAIACQAWGARWTEEDFYLKNRILPPYAAQAGNDRLTARSVIGGTRSYQVRTGDTFLDLARFYGLGYNEIEEANPGVDPWIAPEGKSIVLPTEWVLPRSSYEGLIVNIPEMRVYYFHPKQGDAPRLVSTFPVGLGRDDWRTPSGKFRVTGKTRNPDWNIPESIQKERIEKNGFSEKVIPGGSPDNPLGKYRLELSLPMYRIHGTNIPWGVGMQVSHGCVRLYPEDVEQLFALVKIGTPGEFVYQPVKLGARDGRIYIEVHPDIYRLTPGLFREARRLLDESGWSALVDMGRVERAVTEQSGVPFDVTSGGVPDHAPDDRLHPAWRSTDLSATGLTQGFGETGSLGIAGSH